jgi:hypothetical protein
MNDIALIAAQQLNKLLSMPEFDVNNTVHLQAVDSLWMGALLSRDSAKREVQYAYPLLER